MTDLYQFGQNERGTDAYYSELRKPCYGKVHRRLIEKSPPSCGQQEGFQEIDR
jgi:hypothetical protein